MIAGRHGTLNVDTSQSLYSPRNTRQTFTRNPEFSFDVSADGDESGSIACAQFFQGDAATPGRVEEDLNADGPHSIQFSVQQAPRQTEGRHADCQHPARYRKRLKNCRLVAFLRNLKGAEQPCRSRTYNGDPL